MKYYMIRTTVFGYVLLSVVGAGIFGGLVIGGYSIADVDIPDEGRMYALLIGFCLWALFFFIRARRNRHRRDYVELAKGYIEWVTYKSRLSDVDKTVRINTDEIRLFEIVYFEGAKEPFYYSVVGGDEKKGQQLELYDIPHETLLQYCHDNRILPVISTIRYLDVDTVSVNAKRIKIQYYPRTSFTWGRSKKISFTDVSAIELVSTHPISETENHYVVTTREGKVYKFSSRRCEQDRLAQNARVDGIDIIKRYIPR
jgi:hypothetical protein